MICGDGNTKKVWKYIKGKRCDASGVAPLKKSGLVHSDPAAKANILNEQFCSVFKFNAEDLANMLDMGDSLYPDRLVIIGTTNGIQKLLKKLNPCKAAKPHNISCHLLGTVVQELALALAYLFRLSLLNDTIPDIWRHALVQPVFKKGDCSSPTNNRLISLTSVCGKIVEHLVRHAISSHLD